MRIIKEEKKKNVKTVLTYYSSTAELLSVVM